MGTDGLVVLTDIFGVSGQLMLESLPQGNADAAQMAAYAKGSAKKKIPEIVASLGLGSVSSAAHCFTFVI